MAAEAKADVDALGGPTEADPQPSEEEVNRLIVGVSFPPCLRREQEGEALLNGRRRRWKNENVK